MGAQTVVSTILSESISRFNPDGAIVLRAGLITGPLTTGMRAKGKPLGYTFTGCPNFVEGLVKQGKLKASDVLVLNNLLKYRLHCCWCWRPKGKIAEDLGYSPRTVQRSFDRLGRAGVIEQKALDGPDPDDTRNWTGWRVYFLWLTPKGYEPGPGPARPGKGARKSVNRQDCFFNPSTVPPETSVSPGGRHTCLGEGETQLSPNYAGDSALFLDETELDGVIPPSSSSNEIAVAAPGPETTTTDDALVSLTPSRGEIPEGMQAVIEAAQECLGETVAGQIEANALAVVALVGGDVNALAVAVKKTGVEVARDYRNKPLSNVLRYALKVATNERGIDPSAAVKALNDFSRGKRLSPVTSEEAREELSQARQRKQLAEMEADEARREVAQREAERLAEEQAEQWRSVSAVGLVTAVEALGVTLALQPDGKIHPSDCSAIPEALYDRLKANRSAVLAILTAREEPEAPPICPVPVVPKQATVVAAAPVDPVPPEPGPVAMTPGQNKFLATLSPAQRETLEAMTAAERAYYLRPHTRGYDEIIGRELVKRLSPRIVNCSTSASVTTREEASDA